ncbi:MAG: hypothetical protein ACJBCI_06220, partial [Candidatus Tisiphia sp.]
MRSSVGVTRRDRLRNGLIRWRFVVEAMVERMKREQLKWFGHLLRMEEYRLPRMMHEKIMEGR